MVSRVNMSVCNEMGEDLRAKWCEVSGSGPSSSSGRVKERILFGLLRSMITPCGMHNQKELSMCSGNLEEAELAFNKSLSLLEVLLRSLSLS